MLVKKLEGKVVPNAFKLYPVTEATVLKHIKKLKNKKCSGTDGLSADLLKQGGEVLAIPITRIINLSITSGTYPKPWKEGIITPIHKKGDKKSKGNYRPISILKSASKVLESVVFDQLYRYAEAKQLLPPTQHGFRQKHSNFTALTSMHTWWLEQKEKKMTTGILCFDLSCAFDLMEPDIFCRKLSLMGGNGTAIDWFRSYLSDRSQRVKVGSTISKNQNINIGSPQGGLLSPLIFILYVSDLRK